MAIEVKLSADCKTLTISGGTANADVELHINEVQCPMIATAGTVNPSTGVMVPNGSSPEDVETLDNTGNLVITWDIIPCVTTEQLNGVIKVIITEPQPIG
jgi:hypothetical protein